MQAALEQRTAGCCGGGSCLLWGELMHPLCAALRVSCVLCAADRSAVVQLNFQLIAQDAQIHRSIAQRLITEMLQRLAMHIVAGHAIKVAFPGVGELVRNKAGRVEFVFEPQLVEALELGLGPVSVPPLHAHVVEQRCCCAAGTLAPAGTPTPLAFWQQQQPPCCFSDDMLLANTYCGVLLADTASLEGP